MRAVITVRRVLDWLNPPPPEPGRSGQVAERLRFVYYFNTQTPLAKGAPLREIYQELQNPSYAFRTLFIHFPMRAEKCTKSVRKAHEKSTKSV